MILLRNLLLAVGAFLVTGYGFYTYLVYRFPPDQMQASADSLASPLVGSVVRSTPAGGAPGTSKPNSTSVGNIASTGNKASDSTGTSNASQSPSSSSFALFSAVFSDIVAASRSGAEADAARDQAAFEARYRVPDWLNTRFDQQAANAGKALTNADKSALLATLLELRQMKLQQGNQSVEAMPNSGIELSSDWSLTARAMRAELQFRGALNIGLAEFMKSLSTDELQHLLILPMDQTASKNSGNPAISSTTLR